MRRREFLTLLGGAAARAVAGTQAQSSEPATNQRFEWAKHPSCTRGPRFGIEVRELSDREREMLIEEATMAWRSRSLDGPTLEHHTGADLDAVARQIVSDEASIMCVLEAALDRDAYSTVVRVVAAVTAKG